MKSVAICGNRLVEAGVCDSTATVTIAGIPVSFGRANIPAPAFDPDAVAQRSLVLIKVRAFSCNYRDIGYILGFNQRCREDSCFCVGSEFVGEVIAVGSDVTRLQRGDRVIANNRWPDSGVKNLPAGIPSSHASQRYRLLHEAKLIKISDTMPDVVAAAFSVGAQTSYSMLRRLNLTEGANILVTAARSNTSLFAINALKKYGVNVYATTTSRGFERQLRKMGVKELIEIDTTLERFLDNERIKEIIAETYGFDCVIDPFYDLHVGKLPGVMAHGARYITCGLFDQYTALTNDPFRYQGASMLELMSYAINKNIQFMGNCLGTTEDLTNAIEDYCGGSLDVIVDSVFSDGEIGAFFDRTYNAKDRWGKVVYQYDAD